MLPLCWQEGVAVIPWSPLARGRLTRPWGETTARLVSDDVGKNLYDESDKNDAQIAERLAGVSEALGATRAQVALARYSVNEASPRRLSALRVKSS